MQTGLTLVWLGALLIICGLLATAAKMLWRGRLSDARQVGAGQSGHTLEPRTADKRIRLKELRLGLILMAGGALLLLAGATL